MGIDHLVVMAAGRGSRMDPLTRTRPKVLLPVAGAPLMTHLLRSAGAAGFTRATLIVHHGADQVRSALADDPAGLDVAFVEQGHPGGTGHAVASLAGHVEDDFVLASGDAWLDADDLRALRAANGTAVGGHEVPDVRAYGALDVEGTRLVGVREKPVAASAGLVNTGSYRLPVEMIRRCQQLRPSPRGELELTDAVTAWARQGEVTCIPMASWMEAGRPWELLDLQAHLLARQESRIDGDVGSRVDMEGPVVVETGARILNGTRIEGPCHIGIGAKVGPGAYLRPSTMLGAGAHVGGSVEVKNSILGARSHVPHLSYVGDSVIGSDCNLGAGTQVANLKVTPRGVRVHWQGRQWIDTGRRKLGTIMGDGVKTGVNCSINPGTVLAPGVCVGAGEVLSGWMEPPTS